MTRRALIMWAAVLLAPVSAFAQAPPPDTEVGLASSALVTFRPRAARS